MQYRNKCNYISIAKAIGIILMVMGHSGSPNVLSRFLYMFHMPLFFICSGYFFKEMTDTIMLKAFYQKKVKRLYLPYLRWSLLFLILHNLFFQIDIYNSQSHIYVYSATDFFKQFARTIFMTDFELLIRPFWFIKELLLASFLIAIISYLRTKVCQILSNELLLVIMILFTTGFKYVNLHLLIIGDCSVLTFSAVYFYSGIVFRKYEYRIPNTTSITGLTFLTTFIGSYYYIGEIDMRYTTENNLIPYYLLSLSGVIMTFNVSKWLNNISFNTYLYYIGSHTMPILALNLLALKVGNLIKIWMYGMPIDNLSSYTIIYEHNNYFWVIYTIIGVAIPLICYSLHKNITRKMKIIKNKVCCFKKM